MPLLRFDLMEGRTESEIAALLDAAHRALLDAFHVDPRDRYQIVQEHKPAYFRVEDTGLAIERSGKVVVVSMTTRPRTVEEKTAFYRLLCERLQDECGIEPSDVMVNILENTDADWSFGNGQAQFLNGELASDGSRGP